MGSQTQSLTETGTPSQIFRHPQEIQLSPSPPLLLGVFFIK